MRLLAIALLLSSLSPGASAACVELGCVHATDTDGDAVPDYVLVATAVDHAGALNAYADKDEAYSELIVSSEERGDPSHNLQVLTYANAGGTAAVFVAFHQVDEATGEQVQMVAFSFAAIDTDGNGLPDDLQADTVLP